MAEEKKTGKKFCTKCGRPLKEGEVCDCQKEKKEVKKEVVKETPKKVEQPKVVSQPVYGNVVMQPVASEPNKFVIFIKSVWKDVILETIKNPYDTIKSKYEENNTFNTIMMLLLISVAFSLMGCGAIHALMKSSLGDYSSAVSIPYLSFFVFFLVLSFIYSFIPISGAFITEKLPRLKPNVEIDYKGLMNIYAISNSPMVYVYAALAVLLFLNITHWIIWCLLVACIICCWSNFIVSYLGIASPEKNMKAYSISLILVLTIVIVAVVVKLFGNTITDTLSDICADIKVGGISVGSAIDFSDLFSSL